MTGYVQEAIYCDGGTVGRNPSPLGGPWAWRRIGRDGETVVGEGWGVVYPTDLLGEIHPLLITNNQTEFYALLKALEALPSRWEGKVCSDSLLTLCRFFRNVRANQGGKLYPTRGLPQGWVDRRNLQLSRLGRLVFPVLLSGHPTKEHLEKGIGARGTPVSLHNVWCDRKCFELSERVKAGHHEQEGISGVQPQATPQLSDVLPSSPLSVR